MIKKFENFVNESKMTRKNKDIMYMVHRLLDDINHHLLDGSSYSSIYDYIKKLESAYEHENIKKVILYLTELRDEIVGSHRYKILVKRIDDILDLDLNKINWDEINWDDIDDNDSKELKKLKQDIEKELDDIDDDYPTNKGKIGDYISAHSKFDFIREVAREYFDEKSKDLLYEVTDEDGKVGVGTKRDDFYKNKEELKKIRRVLGTTLDLDYRTCEMIEDRLIKLSKERGFHYTSEELKEIFTKLDESDIRRFVKEFIDLSNIHREKGVERICKFIRKNKYPFVVSPNGKILTGEVFYNPVLGIFAKTEDEMEYLIDIFKKSDIYEKITDYFENLPDVSKYELVDLDKKTKWGTKEHDWRKSIEN